MKKNNRTWIITGIICLLPVLAGILLYDRLPDTIVTHWGANGEPNGWSGKFVGVIVFPGALFLLSLALPLIMKLDPKYASMTEKTKAIPQWIMAGVSVFASSITLTAALGIDVNIPFYCVLFMGLLFTIVGNYLPKFPRTYTVGIRLPWTLDNDVNWEKTHRLAGFTWVICGLLTLVCAFLPFRMIAVGILFAAVVIPIVYSFLLFRKEKSSDT